MLTIQSTAMENPSDTDQFSDASGPPSGIAGASAAVLGVSFGVAGPSIGVAGVSSDTTNPLSKVHTPGKYRSVHLP
jgi:hypothetical protein